MESRYSNADKAKALETLLSIDDTLSQLREWNRPVESSKNYYDSPGGMQLLAATCMLLTAIGEGINRIKRSLPEFFGINLSRHSVEGYRGHAEPYSPRLL